MRLSSVTRAGLNVYPIFNVYKSFIQRFRLHLCLVAVNFDIAYCTECTGAVLCLAGYWMSRYSHERRREISVQLSTGRRPELPVSQLCWSEVRCFVCSQRHRPRNPAPVRYQDCHSHLFSVHRATSCSAAESSPESSQTASLRSGARGLSRRPTRANATTTSVPRATLCVVASRNNDSTQQQPHESVGEIC